MQTQALYRAWRPMLFQDVSGQDAVITTLRNQIASGRISHAYLFSGSRGTGKTTTAKLFARAVNCLTPADGEPCGHCDACVALAEDNNLDIVEIDAASNNGVDEIRDLREKVKYPPQHGRYRVYIIDEVHMLSTGAFNALLKTLEEPPPHALFILATTEPQRLPATVLSRVQRYDFRRIPAQVIVDRLSEIVKGEHGEATPEALALIARSAEGGMRDAISLLDMALSYGGGSVDAALIREILGATDKAFLFAFTDHLISGDASGAVRDIDTLMRGGREPNVFARDVTQHLRALLMAQTMGAQLADLLETTEEDATQYREQAAKSSRERLLVMLDQFLDSETDMKWSSQPRTALEVAAVRACMPEDALQLEPLAARVDVLEKKVEAGVPVATAATAKPARAEKPAAATASTSEGASDTPPQASASAKDIWEKAKGILRKDTPLFAPLMQGQFAGIEGDVARLVYKKEQEIFCNMLRQEGRKERIEAALAEAAGRPIAFIAELQMPAQKSARVTNDVMQQAFDTFGRDKVQIVDDPETV